jgi:hypothetical protein
MHEYRAQNRHAARTVPGGRPRPVPWPGIPSPWIPVRTVLSLCLLLAFAGVTPVASAAATAPPAHTWGFGWDDGLTVRRWLGAWELSLAAGPDDDLVQIESTDWNQADPALVEVPRDERRESGWVRGQIGYRLQREGPLTLVGFAGLTYNWIDYQDKIASLDPVSGGYDVAETNRFTHRWAWEVGLRPAWNPYRWLTVEFSFGLRYAWERWDESTVEQNAGAPDPDRVERDGEGSSFQDFGWDGLSSLAFVFWL